MAADNRGLFLSATTTATVSKSFCLGIDDDRRLRFNDWQSNRDISEVPFQSRRDTDGEQTGGQSDQEHTKAPAKHIS
jgi:hypothetical protein